jgi:hypothetical protein
MDWLNLFEESPAVALGLICWLAVVSHVWNAARILDRRRSAKRRAASVERSHIKARAFLATLTETRS